MIVIAIFMFIYSLNSRNLCSILSLHLLSRPFAIFRCDVVMHHEREVLSVIIPLPA